MRRHGGTEGRGVNEELENLPPTQRLLCPCDCIELLVQGLRESCFFVINI